MLTETEITEEAADMQTAAATAPASPPASVTTLPTAAPPRRPPPMVVTDPIPVLDTARFEHMQRIANVMAHSNLMPDALCKVKDGNNLVSLTPNEIISNCFLVVNQAVRWGMDPFAVAQCVSVVHGKLCYEGKLIAAVLDAKLGLKLEYEISGEGENMRVVVSASLDGRPVLDSKGNLKTVTGTVADWQTTGNGSPWAARGGRPRMLRYRGAREWTRVYEPAVMLGVYAPDEMEDLSDDYRARRAHDVTTTRSEPASLPPDPPEPRPAAPAAPAPIEPSEPKEPAALAMTEPTTPTTANVTTAAEMVVWGETEERPATAEDVPDPTEPGRVVVMSAAGTPIVSPLMYVDRWIAECKEAAAKATTFDELKAAGEKHLKGREERVRPEQYEEARAAFGARETEIESAARAAKAKGEAFDVADWLKQLDGAFSGCESVDELVATQGRLMVPHKGAVSDDDYTRAGKLAVAAFARINQ